MDSHHGSVQKFGDDLTHRFFAVVKAAARSDERL